MIHPELMLLIIVANGVPVLAFDLFHNRFVLPIDLGCKLGDSEFLFGPSKTWRGLFFSLLITALIAMSLGMSWITGLVIAASAMLGDLLSSFIKRRLNMVSGSMALGIDQVPESLIPLLVVADTFDLNGESILAMVVTFFVLEILLSRVLFRLHLRKHPY